MKGKHFVKSKSVESPKKTTEDEATNAHSGLYMYVACLLQVTKYISRRGNIVSSPFVSVKAFGDACRLMDVR